MSFASEFREFAVKGNVMDLAVGVIIGAAFGKIVDSLVKDLIMPIVGRIFGGLDFSNWFIMLASPPAGYSGPMTYEALTKAGRAAVRLRQFHHDRHQFHHPRVRDLRDGEAGQPAEARGASPRLRAPTPEDVVLLREIRDALKK